MESQQFHAPTKIVYGTGSITQIGVEVGRFGVTRPLIATDMVFVSLGYIDTICEALRSEGMQPVVSDQVSHEPTVDLVGEVTALARAERCDCVIGVGGGSCLDTAKAAAMLLTNSGLMEEYLIGRSIERPPVPTFAVPTTFGTGSEVTAIAVIGNPQDGYKKGLKSKHFFPRVAFVDPILGRSMPPLIAASSSIDAFAHALEAYTSRSASPFSDMLALRAIELIGQAVQEVAGGGRPSSALPEMALGSTLAGMSFSNSSTGLAHTIAERIAATRERPHGELVAAVLPAVIQFNLPVARTKYARVAQALTQASHGAAGLSEADLPMAVRALCGRLGLKTRLSELGITDEDLVEIRAQPMGGTSLLSNARQADRHDVLALCRQVL